ncbi:Histidine kinase-, DNA gyrase B-, and HSP90-like ATPase [compost metagenome]
MENAVIHGLEAWSDASRIHITGVLNESGASLIVEDDGRGMNVERRQLMQHNLQDHMDEAMGCGLWNVHQRLQLRFRGTAGVSFASSPLGGLKVTISWQPVSG